MPARILVAGAGSWGTALAILLARNGHRVTLWGHEASHMQSLAQNRENQRYLPGVTFPGDISCESELPTSGEDLLAIILAVPCHAVRDVLKQLMAAMNSLPPLCLVCKGLEPETHFLSHEIVRDVLGESQGVSILSGPSFAAEVAAGFPTAVTVAANDPDVASQHAMLFHNDTFRVYTNEDITGVAMAGAVKNVIAIAAGIGDGLGFGANTRAAVITRGLAEIIRLGTAVGGQAETFMGLSGLGDLVLTCTDDQSRNRRLGLALAAGESLDDARRRIGQAIEGARTVAEVCELAKQLSIEMPISAEVLGVIRNESTPRDAVSNLLARDPKPEQME